MRQIIKDASKVRELYVQLWEIDSVDDKCKVEDYDDSFIIEEAKYVLSNYSEPGHVCAEMLASKCGSRKSSFDDIDRTKSLHHWDCDYCIATNDVKELKQFIKKHKAI